MLHNRAPKIHRRGHVQQVEHKWAITYENTRQLWFKVCVWQKVKEPKQMSYHVHKRAQNANLRRSLVAVEPPGLL